MRINKTAMATASAALVLGGLVAAGPASAEPAGAPGVTVLTACGQTQRATVPGGAASWTVQCGATTTHVSGQVRDTRADGKCARVKIWWPGHQTWTYTGKACPKGEVVEFDHNGRTNRTPPSVYLYTV